MMIYRQRPVNLYNSRSDPVFYKAKTANIVNSIVYLFPFRPCRLMANVCIQLVAPKSSGAMFRACSFTRDIVKQVCIMFVQ